MWMLVFVVISYNVTSNEYEPRVDAWYEFNTVYECFAARDSLSETVGRGDGFFYPNSQAVCVPVTKS